MEFYTAIKKNEVSVYADVKISPRPAEYFNKWKRARYKTMSTVYEPFHLDGNSKLLMVFTTGERGL